MKRRAWLVAGAVIGVTWSCAGDDHFGDTDERRRLVAWYQSLQSDGLTELPPQTRHSIDQLVDEFSCDILVEDSYILERSYFYNLQDGVPILDVARMLLAPELAMCPDDRWTEVLLRHRAVLASEDWASLQQVARETRAAIDKGPTDDEQQVADSQAT